MPGADGVIFTLPMVGRAQPSSLGASTIWASKATLCSLDCLLTPCKSIFYGDLTAWTGSIWLLEKPTVIRKYWEDSPRRHERSLSCPGYSQCVSYRHMGVIFPDEAGLEPVG